MAHLFELDLAHAAPTVLKWDADTQNRRIVSRTNYTVLQVHIPGLVMDLLEAAEPHRLLALLGRHATVIAKVLQASPLPSRIKSFLLFIHPSLPASATFRCLL